MRYPTIVAVALVAAAGCDLFNNTLEVQNPSNVPAGGLETPANAQLLVNSAIADFECAAGAYAVMGGEITDELIDATQTADRYPYERRSMVSSDARYAVNGCVGLGVYTPLQTARFSAVNVLSLLEGWTDAQVPGRDTLIAQLEAYEGYSLVLLGEGFCSMVVSTLDGTRPKIIVMTAAVPGLVDKVPSDMVAGVLGKPFELQTLVSLAENAFPTPPPPRPAETSP